MIIITIGNVMLSIDSKKPDEHGVAAWAGDSAKLAAWLPSQYGMFGHRVGDNPAPMDVIAALIASKKEFRVVRGQEILDLPIAPLPEGAIS